jgi:hypothetical protein
MQATHTQFECRTRLRVRPRKDKRGVDLISDELPFGALWSLVRLLVDRFCVTCC